MWRIRESLTTLQNTENRHRGRARRNRRTRPDAGRTASGNSALHGDFSDFAVAAQAHRKNVVRQGVADGVVAVEELFLGVRVEVHLLEAQRRHEALARDRSPVGDTAATQEIGRRQLFEMMLVVGGEGLLIRSDRRATDGIETLEVRENGRGSVEQVRVRVAIEPHVDVDLAIPHGQRRVRHTVRIEDETSKESVLQYRHAEVIVGFAAGRTKAGLGRDFVNPMKPPRTLVHVAHPARNPTSPRRTILTEAVVREHQASVWRYLRYLGCDPATADELTQEAFLALLQAVVPDRGIRTVGAWLRGTARHLAYARFRSQVRLRASLRELSDASTEAGWNDYALDDGGAAYRSALDACLATLTERERHALMARHGEGNSREAIASSLGIGIEGTKSLLRRAKARLRTCIEKRTES